MNRSLPVPQAQRIHIGFFGCCNSGKSSLINRLTHQNVSVVSSMPGTTTDLVTKAMELLPLGPVLILDTPGLDDESRLGQKRIQKTREALRRCDIAILVHDGTKERNETEKQLIQTFEQMNTPYLIVQNKCDQIQTKKEGLYVSALTGEGIEKLKNIIASSFSSLEEKPLLKDLVKQNNLVLLIAPIDESAPKGRIILPQQMALREILDQQAIAITLQPQQIPAYLKGLSGTLSLAITDSQAFAQAAKQLPDSVPLTSFSILMARKKGFLKQALQGAKAIHNLQEHDKVLIAEGCTHHRQCKDIGSIQLPALLQKFTKKTLRIELSSGKGFPEDLSSYSLVIHCGGCMLNDKEVQFRMKQCAQAQVPVTNFGTALAYMKGILFRSVSMLKEKEVLEP